MNNLEIHEKSDHSEDQIVNFINYREKQDPKYDSSDDNYVAMLEQITRMTSHH